MANEKVGPDGLVKQVFMIGCSVSVTGRTTKKSDPTTTRSGETIEREYEVEERIENKDQYDRANKLAGTLRQLADKYGSSTKYGYLTGPEGKDAFERELARLINGPVATHNAEANQTAIITPDPVTLPIGLVFGPKDTRAILDHLMRELSAQRDALALGNTDAVTTWLKRGQRLGAMLPALNATVITGTIESIREAKNVIAARIRTHFADADAYRATLGKPLENVEILKDALQCVEWDRACEQIESALGWLAPQSENANANVEAAS